MIKINFLASIWQIQFQEESEIVKDKDIYEARQYFLRQERNNFKWPLKITCHKAWVVAILKHETEQKVKSIQKTAG